MPSFQQARNATKSSAPPTKNGRLCWEVDVFTNIGKRQTVWVEETTGLVVAAKSKVTMGRGDPFELLLELDTLKEADAKTTAEHTGRHRICSNCKKTSNAGPNDQARTLQSPVEFDRGRPALAYENRDRYAV
jgi:hypothetical protein